MQTSVVMTMLGPDRPGLVESLSAVVARHGGNWVESNMSHLAGHFAGILRIQVPRQHEAALIADLRGLETTRELKVIVQPSSETAPTTGYQSVLVDLVGHDRPGIVSEISRIFADRKINVEELDTQCTSAPMSADALFKATARLRVPGDVDVDDLRRDLENIAAEMMIDIFVEPDSE